MEKHYNAEIYPAGTDIFFEQVPLHIRRGVSVADCADIPREDYTVVFI